MTLTLNWILINNSGPNHGLTGVLHSMNVGNIVILTGDFNALLVSDNSGFEFLSENGFLSEPRSCCRRNSLLSQTNSLDYVAITR